MKLRARGNGGWILLAWLFSGALAWAQHSSLEVRSPSSKLIATPPGRIVTASVVVQNRGSEADEIVERFTLPQECQRVAPPDLPLDLPPGGQTVRVLAVLVPATMPAGLYDFRYTAQSRRDPSSIGSVDFSLQVTPVDGLDFTIEPQPRFVVAGDAYPVKLRVTNRGNSRLAVRLTHRSTLGFDISVDAPAFSLEAGASREIFCQVRTPATFAEHTRHAARFDVTATTVAGETLTASQASVVELIPRVTGPRDPFHYLPMQLRLTALGEPDREPQLQAELSGAGSLDEAGQHRVDFLLRGPDVQNASLSGEREEYGATYQNESWRIDLGDRVFALSPLTEKHSLGRGVGVQWQEGKLAAGAFYMSTRFRRENSSEFGAFVRHDATGAFSVQASFLRKTGSDAALPGILPQNIATVETRFRHSKAIDLRLEAGVSRTDSGGTDGAWRAEARGELPGKFAYALEHVHAGPQFHGYYSANRTSVLSVSKDISPAFRVRASLQDYAANPGQSDIRSSVVNRERSWRAGGDYDLGKRTSLSLEWQHTERSDILLPAAYDFTSDALRVGASHAFERVRLQGFLDLGTLDNSLIGERGDLQRYSAFAHWQPTTRQTYSVFGSYGPSAFTGSTAKELTAGVSARWQLRDHLEANLSYARNQFDGLTGGEQDQALGSIRYQFENKSALSLIGRWTRGGSKDADGSAGFHETAVLATYSVPLTLAVSRKRSIGILEGRLCGAGYGQQRGVPRVVLRVGEQFAVTDSEGFFEFPSLAPGLRELCVMADSLPPRLTMATPLPMKVRIRPAGTTRVELTVAPACAVEIQITRYHFAEGNAFTASGALRESGGEEGVVVELSKGREVWRAQTDRTGAVSFDRLPGGDWSLRVAAGNLPALHTLEAPPSTLTLRPGESRRVALRVLPQRRTLRMLDRGTIQ